MRFICADKFWRELTNTCEGDNVRLAVVYELLEQMDSIDVETGPKGEAGEPGIPIAYETDSEMGRI